MSLFTCQGEFLGNKICTLIWPSHRTIGMTSYDQQVKESAGGNKGKSALSLVFDFYTVFIHWNTLGIRRRY